jgi:hypothetical protein
MNIPTLLLVCNSLALVANIVLIVLNHRHFNRINELLTASRKAIAADVCTEPAELTDAPFVDDAYARDCFNVVLRHALLENQPDRALALAAITKYPEQFEKVVQAISQNIDMKTLVGGCQSKENLQDSIGKTLISIIQADPSVEQFITVFQPDITEG